MWFFKSLTRRFQRRRHNVLCAGILKTPPLRTDGSRAVIVSMVCHRDVIMYLVAAKSFHRRLGDGAFILIDDGSLTDGDRAILREHLGSPEILPIGEIAHSACPRGGTWERLLKILELAQDRYVIQLDADTLTVDDVSAVKACIENNVSFTLGTNAGRVITPALEAAELARTKPGNHIQDIAERNLGKLAGADSLRYVRGCSGFAGFARKGVALDTATSFSAQMQTLLGARWHEWGSEQVTSNYVVANSPGAVVLPYPQYVSFQDKLSLEDVKFLHFIGSHRYDGGVYSRLSRDFIGAIAPYP